MHSTHGVGETGFEENSSLLSHTNRMTEFLCTHFYVSFYKIWKTALKVDFEGVIEVWKGHQCTLGHINLRLPIGCSSRNAEYLVKYMSLEFQIMVWTRALVLDSSAFP